MLAHFFAEGEPLGRRCVDLHRLARGDQAEWLGWFLTPPRATHVQLELPPELPAPCVESAADRAVPDASLTELTLERSPERDPKCHPLANVPRWSTCAGLPQPRVLLPASLAALAPLLEGVAVEFLTAPRSPQKLAELLRGGVLVLDPEWAAQWRLNLDDLRRIASTGGWLLADLETAAFALQRSGAARTSAVTFEARHELFSARVEYSDGPTRGFALQDVLPFTFVDAAGALGQRSLTANRSWKRYAREAGCATLLSSETPWEEHHADVLSAAEPCGPGELIFTDLPWLAAGRLGRPLAPRLVEHLLRMHVGAPLADGLQFWTRWEDGLILTRDISDFVRRYPPLRAIRWRAEPQATTALSATEVGYRGRSMRTGLRQGVASAEPACLGLALAGPSGANGTPQRGLLIRSGLIDETCCLDGLPPEPMILAMKWLVLELRAESDWARQHLTGCSVTWQFDTVIGAKYATHFDAAPPLQATRVLELRMGRGTTARSAEITTGPLGTMVHLPGEGLYGDGSLEILRTLQGVIARELRACRSS